MIKGYDVLTSSLPKFSTCVYEQRFQVDVNNKKYSVEYSRFAHRCKRREHFTTAGSI